MLFIVCQEKSLFPIFYFPNNQIITFAHQFVVYMKRKYKILLSLLSGLLLAAAWPERGFPFLLFIGFVPLLVVEFEQWKDRENNNASAMLPYIALSISSWVLLTTWWVYISTPIGIIATILVNTSLVGGAFYMFHITHRLIKFPLAAYIALIGYMLTAEFIHLRWDLNFPWLNLGNGFSAYPSLIQWYEYTGIFGGSLWILIVNILIFYIVRDSFLLKLQNKKIWIRMAVTLILIILPITISLIMYNRYSETLNPIDVVVVQPNLDPYNEQFELKPIDVTDRMLAQASAIADSLTDFAVFPESAIQEQISEDQIEYSPSVAHIRTFNSKFKRMNVITGISTHKIFAPGEPLSPSVRQFRDTAIFYDSYNTALLVSHDSSLQKYHKSRLTPGVELMPYLNVFPFLKKFAIDLGGTTGSLGVNPDQTPFTLNENLKIAPVICYESVYGEFLNRFIVNGANVIFVITNDGWWGNTAGHRQHLLFSAVRAIETRRSIARSANTGISCFINQRGDISQRTEYWKPAAIRQKINTNDKITFYVKYGDYIGRIFLWVAAVFALLTISDSIRKRKFGIR
jgi:apolipoprotein N-acyltransferase